jgi:acetyl-CoA carboxylase biotin carboxyl carrier protein
MKAKEIRDLIDFISNSGLDEVNIETPEFKLAVKKNSPVVNSIAEVPAVTVQPVVAELPNLPLGNATADSAPVVQNNYVEIKSPMIGTFYTSSGPDTEAFVKIGDTVKVGETVCIIEAMKLFNEIESEYSGKIIKVLVENSSPVEYDQPLFLVDPS